MNKKHIWIIGCLAVLLVAINAQAFYFTIQLHNGNEMNTVKYWEDGDKISFYSRGGTVSLPRTMIKNIMRVDGELESETVYFSTDFLTGLTDEPEEATSGQEWGKAEPSAEQTEEFVADIRDRLTIISSNLENLERNREMFLRQREGYEQDRERARVRVDEARNESLLSADDRAERVQLEEARIKDAEAKMARVDDQIRNNARMIDTQKKMQARLEKELADLTR